MQTVRDAIVAQYRDFGTDEIRALLDENRAVQVDENATAEDQLLAAIAATNLEIVLDARRQPTVRYPETIDNSLHAHGQGGAYATDIEGPEDQAGDDPQVRGGAGNQDLLRLPQRRPDPGRRPAAGGQANRPPDPDAPTVGGQP